MACSAVTTLVLGVVHLVFTWVGPNLRPRDPALEAAMRQVPLGITTETTIWRAYVGFNASHAMALLLFGLVYGFLALRHPALLFESTFLRAVGVVMLAGLAVLARLYWFSVPLAGVSFALVCFVASIVVAL